MLKIYCYQREKDTKEASKKILHQKLSHYLNIDSTDLHIETNENGKPSAEGIHYSVSHCRDQIVQAFSLGGELGIDVEFNNPQRNYMALAQRYFHAQEFKYLSALNNEQAISLFYNLWTTKEAICKAQGGRLWYYLAENCLNKSKNIKSTIKGLHIVQLHHFSDYSLTLATQTKPKKMEIIDE